jgi:uncharacterized protein
LKSFTVVVALLLLTGLGVADEHLPPRVVRVVGTADVKTVPDEALIELGVEKQSPNAATAKRLADNASREILASLRQNGVAEKDMQTTFIALQPQFNYRKGMRISYFVAEQTISFTVQDLSRLDSLLESLIKAGGNRIDSIRYEVSDLRKYRDQARDLAVKAAREKAEALAKALGQDVGKAYSIDEVPQYNYQYSAGLVSNETLTSTRVAKTGPSTAPGQNTISASVVVSFDLN